MNVENELQDDFVPLPVIQIFAKNFIQGFSGLMKEIGFKHTMPHLDESSKQLSKLDEDMLLDQ